MFPLDLPQSVNYGVSLETSTWLTPLPARREMPRHVVAKAHVGQAGRFILPSAPVRKAAPPSGPDWIHEVKFDGWRVQLHKDGHSAVVLSRNNRDLTRRFRSVRDSLLALPAPSAIIDGELVDCDIPFGQRAALAALRGVRLPLQHPRSARCGRCLRARRGTAVLIVKLVARRAHRAPNVSSSQS